MMGPKIQLEKYSVNFNKHIPNSNYSSQTNQGYGGALCPVSPAANSEWVFYTDGDASMTQTK